MGTQTAATVGAARSGLMANQQALGSATVGGGAGAAKSYAQSILANYGWGPDQFDPLDKLWTRESGWRVDADNPTSDAYGIPQSLPGSKMASAGDDWMTNPATQIKWGLGYIKGRYGNPAAAWQHSEATNWYKNGGSLRVNKPTMIGVGEGAGPEDVQIKPLQGSSGRARNGSGGKGGGGGHNFTTNITVGMMIGDESGLEQLTDMIGNRMAEDLRRARGATMEDDLDF
jgi:hypothetical protein